MQEHSKLLHLQYHSYKCIELKSLINVESTSLEKIFLFKAGYFSGIRGLVVVNERAVLFCFTGKFVGTVSS